ncbi:MAG: MCP four helix bundle domain-containing protein, partial [Nitrosomonadales bacterium]|nr:MCP four helix bundle domain-containing protein [Nitrosomonadales bacterium]
MTVAQRIYALIIGASVGFIALAMVSYSQVKDVYEEANYANVNSLPSAAVLNDVSLNFNTMRIWVSRHILYNDPAKKLETELDIEKFRAQLDENYKSYEQFVTDDTEQALLDNVRAKLGLYYIKMDAILEASRQNKVDLARDLYVDIANEARGGNAAINELSAHNRQLAQEKAEHAEQVFSSANRISLIATIVLLLLMAGTGYYIIRTLMQQLGGEPSLAVEVAKQIARGDVSTAIALKPEDKESLLASMSVMQATIQSLIAEQGHMASENKAGVLDARMNAD